MMIQRGLYSDASQELAKFKENLKENPKENKLLTDTTNHPKKEIILP